MIDKRATLARALSRSGLLEPIGRLRMAAVAELRVLAYHRVLPEVDERLHRGDVELVSATAEAFDWQMAHVASRYTPVSGRQVLEAVDGVRPLPARPVLVTFDDGFADNHDVAWPILRHRGVPAIFFVATDVIDRGEPFWFDALVDAAVRLRGQVLALPGIEPKLPATDDPAQRRRDVLKLLSSLKRVPDAARRRALQGLPAPGSGAAGDGPEGRPLRWDQLRAMVASGMEVGSHTASHPVLTRVASDDELARELVHPRRRIRDETGQDASMLAYPVGGRDAVDARVLAAVRQAGYRLAFTYQSGVDRLPLATPLELRRLHVERDVTREMFRATMALPPLFAR